MIDEKTIEKFLKELEKSGNVGVAAARVGIHRSTIYRRREKDEEFRNKMDEAEIIGRENNVDIAEQGLMMNVKERDPRSIEFYLKNNSPRYRQPLLPLLKEFENIFPGQGLTRLLKARYLRNDYENRYHTVLPSKPHGYDEISDLEIEKYKWYLDDWFDNVLGSIHGPCRSNDIQGSASETDTLPKVDLENRKTSDNPDLNSATPDKKPDNNI